MQLGACLIQVRWGVAWEMSHLKEIYKSVQIWKSVIHLEGQSQLDGCYSMHLFSQILNLIWCGIGLQTCKRSFLTRHLHHTITHISMYSIFPIIYLRIDVNSYIRWHLEFNILGSLRPSAAGPFFTWGLNKVLYILAFPLTAMQCIPA